MPICRPKSLLLFDLRADHRRIFGAFLGVPVVSPPHYADTFLVDLNDGGIVWIHYDGAVQGDLRQRESSRRRLDDLWRRFPGFDLLPGRRR